MKASLHRAIIAEAKSRRSLHPSFNIPIHTAPGRHGQCSPQDTISDNGATVDPIHISQSIPNATARRQQPPVIVPPLISPQRPHTLLNISSDISICPMTHFCITLPKSHLELEGTSPGTSLLLSPSLFL
jgi:hypothetical protein